MDRHTLGDLTIDKMNMDSTSEKKDKPSYFAIIHFLGFLISVPISNLGEGWYGIIVWAIWAFIDFPISLLYIPLLQSGWWRWVDSVSASSTILQYLLYPPYLIHGILGTIWWFYLPRIYTRIKIRREMKA